MVAGEILRMARLRPTSPLPCRVALPGPGTVTLIEAVPVPLVPAQTCRCGSDSSSGDGSRPGWASVLAAVPVAVAVGIRLDRRGDVDAEGRDRPGRRGGSARTGTSPVNWNISSPRASGTVIPTSAWSPWGRGRAPSRSRVSAPGTRRRSWARASRVTRRNGPVDAGLLHQLQELQPHVPCRAIRAAVVAPARQDASGSGVGLRFPGVVESCTTGASAPVHRCRGRLAQPGRAAGSDGDMRRRRPPPAQSAPGSP